MLAATHVAFSASGMFAGLVFAILIYAGSLIVKDEYPGAAKVMAIFALLVLIFFTFDVYDTGR